MKHIRRTIAACITFALLLGAVPAFAIGAKGLGGYPTTYNPEQPLTKSWFIFNLGSGESAESSITVENYSDEAMQVMLYPVDSTVNNMGGFALEMDTEARDMVGAWITLAENEFSLAAGTKKDIPFTFTVPSNVTEPGEYAGGIIVQERPDEEAASGITIATRIGVRVYNTVPGEVIRSLALTDFTASYDHQQNAYLVSAKIKNEGNVTTPATATLMMENVRFGKSAWEPLEKQVDIPPQTEIETNFVVDDLGFGKYDMALGIDYAQGDDEKHLQSETLSFWAFPWAIASWVGLLIALNIAFVCIRAISRAFSKRGLREYTVQPRETIETVADKFGMSWRKLVAINHLRKPYGLKAKQKLYVRPAKTVKGTRAVPFSAARAWTVATFSLAIMVVALSGAAWSVTKTTDPAILRGSVLQSWLK